MSEKVTIKVERQTHHLPAIALRGLVVFPNNLVHFEVGRDKSIAAIEWAMGNNSNVFLVAQKKMDTDEPTRDDLFTYGVVAEIKQVLRVSDELVRVLVEGKYRARMTDLDDGGKFLLAAVQPAPVRGPKEEDALQTDAMVRSLKSVFDDYLALNQRLAKDVVFAIVSSDDPVFLSEYIPANLLFRYEDKQAVMDENTLTGRLEKLIELLRRECQVMEIEKEISDKVNESMDKNQRDYYLHEQLNIISSELGEGDDTHAEAEDYRRRILELHLEEESETKLLKEVDRLAKMQGSNQEATVIRTYLDTCLDLPWNTFTEDDLDIVKAQQILDHDHYGLKKVKDRILELLAVRKLAPDIKGQIICLVGPPGVGKTSIARSIAEAIGRKYVRVSLGGVRDESDIVGHRKTYVGAMPGRIISAIKQAGTKNPLLLLDEIDKLSHDFRGDPASALLEVLDSEQNATFYDHYIDMPFDLSDVMFITTANDYSAIPEPLADRMDVITLGSYTHEEKFQIATKHLIPKQFKKHGISSKQVRIQPAAVHALIDGYTREAGVRNLERQVAALCRKCAVKLVEDGEAKITIAAKDLEGLLGPAKFKNDDLHKTDEVGLVNGLAWTSVGGELLPIEVAVMEGTGKIELTGSLGDVMKESARTAISCIRTRASMLGIDHNFHAKYDIHIHAPEGAIPKDGPSAGTAMATAITSALCNIPIRHDVAMTGEITLLGRVLPIGGLKEKTMAAYRAGIKTVIIPSDNVPDLAEVDDVVKNSVHFLPVQKVDQVLEAALVRMPEPKPESAHTPSGILPTAAGQAAATAPQLPQ